MSSPSGPIEPDIVVPSASFGTGDESGCHSAPDGQQSIVSHNSDKNEPSNDEESSMFGRERPGSKAELESISMDGASRRLAQAGVRNALDLAGETPRADMPRVAR